MSRRMAATLLGFAASMAVDEHGYAPPYVPPADLHPPQTDEHRDAARARAEAKRARRRARNLALRDAAITRGLRRAAREGRLVVVWETPAIVEVPA